MIYFVLGGRTLPGIRGDAGRNGLPGQPGLRYVFLITQQSQVLLLL